MMLTALQLSLDGFELGYHSLLRRDPPDEGAIAVTLPTIVSETQERESLRFSLSKLLPVTGGKPPELSDTRILSDAAQTIDSAILAILGRLPVFPPALDDQIKHGNEKQIQHGCHNHAAEHGRSH